MKTKIPIGKARRDISEIINRVAYGKERIILTSRGRPKAVLVSMDDYDRLQSLQSPDLARLKIWQEETKGLADRILAKRGGKGIDVDKILTESRNDLENSGGWLTDRD